MQTTHGSERATATPESVAERLNEHLVRARGERLEPAADRMLQFRVAREQLVEFMTSLRDDPALQFKILLDVTAVDFMGQEPRFELVYHLYSVHLKLRIRVKSRCTERDASVPSLVPTFPTADFHEREVYDFFGIRFEGHPDLKRILLPEGFLGHPLRKDYPVEGIEPERVYRMQGGVMMPRPPGAEPIEGAGSSTP